MENLLTLLVSILDFFAFPLNWIAFSVQEILSMNMPVEYAALISTYFTLVVLTSYLYSIYIDRVSVLKILFNHFKLHLLVFLVSLAVLFFSQGKYYLTEEASSGYALLGGFLFLAYTVINYSYDIDVVSKGLKRD